MKKIFAAALLLILCACSLSDGSDSGTRLYYVSDDTDELIKSVYSDITFSSLTALANELAKAPKDVRLRTVMQDAVCNSAELKDDTLYVDFSEEYGALEAHDKILADACVMLTLSEFSGAESVRITVEGQNEIVLSARSIMMTDEVGTPEVLSITVHQIDTYSRELVGNRKRIVLREGQTAVRCLFDELKKSGTNLVSVFPAKTRLISGEISNGILTLDLSADFLTESQTDTPKLIIQGIARSFMDLENVDGVMLLVEGESLGDYYGVEVPEVVDAAF